MRGFTLDYRGYNTWGIDISCWWSHAQTNSQFFLCYHLFYSALFSFNCGSHCPLYLKKNYVFAVLYFLSVAHHHPLLIFILLESRCLMPQGPTTGRLILISSLSASFWQNHCSCCTGRFLAATVPHHLPAVVLGACYYHCWSQIQTTSSCAWRKYCTRRGGNVGVPLCVILLQKGPYAKENLQMMCKIMCVCVPLIN